MIICGLLREHQLSKKVLAHGTHNRDVGVQAFSLLLNSRTLHHRVVVLYTTISYK